MYAKIVLNCNGNGAAQGKGGITFNKDGNTAVWIPLDLGGLRCQDRESEDQGKKKRGVYEQSSFKHIPAFTVTDVEILRIPSPDETHVTPCEKLKTPYTSPDTQERRKCLPRLILAWYRKIFLLSVGNV